MSRILKRPMFRIGGAANDGIISMAQPRKNYQTGSYAQKIEELIPAYEAALGPGRSASDKLSDLLIKGGLNLMSARPTGGFLSTAAGAFKEPAEQFLKSSEAEEALKRQIRLAATTQAISSVDAERLQRMKLEADSRKEQEQRKKELMQQYQLDYTEASIFQNFLNQRDAIGKTVGLPVSSTPLFLSLKKGKYEVTGVKSRPEGIYYDPKTNKYVKIKSGTAIIGNSIQDVMKPENQVISQQSYRDYINEELAKKQRQKIEAEGYTSFDSSSP